jgi:hypothetical protein
MKWLPNYRAEPEKRWGLWVMWLAFALVTGWTGIRTGGRFGATADVTALGATVFFAGQAGFFLAMQRQQRASRRGPR